jgi:hypothetical protein
MRLFLFIIISLISLSSFSQELDSTRKAKRKQISLTKYPRPAPPPEKKSYVVITSGKKQTTGDPWDTEWTDYIEQQSRVIGSKLLAKDSARAVYKVLIEFSVKEDGSLKDLRVSSNPSNEFVVNECIRMALNAPKKKSIYKKGEYVKMSVKQPVDIRVR